MLSRVRARLTYANVVATLALFFALGGGAAYATHLVVRSSDIVDNAVQTRHIENGQVRSPDVQNNGLTGVDVDESSLSGIGPRAYGHVDNSTCETGPFPQDCPVTESRGVAGVQRTNTGEYCIDVPAVPVGEAPLLVSVDYLNNGVNDEPNATALTYEGGAPCPGDDHQVVTYARPQKSVRNAADNGSTSAAESFSNASNEVGFTFLVP